MALDRRPIEQMIADVGEEAFQRLARLFESETREAVIEMRRLVQVPDWRELGRQAHSLKHSTSSFGLDDLAAVAYALEGAADAGMGEKAAELLAHLEQVIEEELGAFDRTLRAL
jgi:HPt (histidine-containing phosphotransfer) domain-containing protein